MGIPYAQVPVGNLRFSPPVVDNLPSWTDIRNGSMMQANCYQNANNPRPKHTAVLNKLLKKVIDMDSMEMMSDQFDEDCLYLNIFVPDGKDESIFGVCLFFFRVNVVWFLYKQKYIKKNKKRNISTQKFPFFIVSI
jgi:carboxylesterase type B